MKGTVLPIVTTVFGVLTGVANAVELEEPQASHPETEILAADSEGKTQLKGRRYQSDPGFGGPGSTESLLAEDDADVDPAIRIPAFDRALKPWFDWKHRINEKIGLEFGVAYTALFQGASVAPADAEDVAASGILRFSGRWALVKRDAKNTGTLAFSIDHRRAYTDIAPSDLGFSAGYLGIPGTLFSDVDTVLVDLNWQQYFNDRKTGLIIGRYDPNDYIDVLGYANPWASFQNLSLLFNASIALPDSSTGIGIGHWIANQWNLALAVNDVNGTVSQLKFFDDFDELYTTVEVSWSPSREERFQKNVHMTLWHADKRVDEGVAESEGIAIGANWTFRDKWMPFIRAGWSNGSAPLYNETVTVGVTYDFASRSDLVGVGINWGKPSDNSLDDQIGSEFFYRFQLAENLAITPSLQLLVDPALNPDEDLIAIIGLRARLTF